MGFEALSIAWSDSLSILQLQHALDLHLGPQAMVSCFQRQHDYQHLHGKALGVHKHHQIPCSNVWVSAFHIGAYKVSNSLIMGSSCQGISLSFDWACHIVTAISTFETNDLQAKESLDRFAYRFGDMHEVQNHVENREYLIHFPPIIHLHFFSISYKACPSIQGDLVKCL